MDIKNDYDLRENAEIIALAMDAAKSLDSTALKAWFEQKYNPKLSEGYVKIVGVDKASGFEKICKESEIDEVGKKISEDHPGAEGYYNFIKFLWVQYPDGKECQLDNLMFED